MCFKKPMFVCMFLYFQYILGVIFDINIFDRAKIGPNEWLASCFELHFKIACVKYAWTQTSQTP